jgi:hypothetical protein
MEVNTLRRIDMAVFQKVRLGRIAHAPHFHFNSFRFDAELFSDARLWHVCWDGFDPEFGYSGDRGVEDLLLAVRLWRACAVVAMCRSFALFRDSKEMQKWGGKWSDF